MRHDVALALGKSGPNVDAMCTDKEFGGRFLSFQKVRHAGSSQSTSYHYHSLSLTTALPPSEHDHMGPHSNTVSCSVMSVHVMNTMESILPDALKTQHRSRSP